MFRIKMYDLGSKVISLKGNCFKKVLEQFLLNLVEEYNISKEEIIRALEEMKNER